MVFFVLLACFAVVNGNGIMHEPRHPQPFKFGYTIRDKDGVQHREESGNGAGVVEGSYGFIDNKGLQRQVNYVADHGGFRAAIKTNEPGTSGQSPAAVNMMSDNHHGAAVPYMARVNNPDAPALYESDGAYGFPTIYGIKAYGPAPYAPVHGHGFVAPTNHQGLVSYNNHRELVAPNNHHGLVAQNNHNELVVLNNHNELVAPNHHHGLVVPMNDGHMMGSYSGALGYGHGRR